MRIQLKAPDPTGNIVTSGKAVFEIPRGAAIHDLTFNVQDSGVDMTIAQIKARITAITVKVNGKAVREYTPTSLDILNATNGAQFAMANGFFRDYFSEPWRRTMEGEERGAWGTQDISQLTVEIQFGAAAVAPTIQCFYNVEEGNRNLRDFPIRQVRTYNGQPVINGNQQWPGGGILREVGLWYDRIHFLSALITAARVEVNKNVKWEDIPRTVLAEILAKKGLALQANTYSIVFSGTSQQLTDQLPSFVAKAGGGFEIVSDLLLRWTGSGAGNVDVVTEQYQVFK